MATPHRDRHIGPAPGNDTAVTLHLLTSLHHQIQAALPEAVTRARDHNYSWAEIGDLPGTTRAAAWNRYSRPHPPTTHHPQ